VTIGRLLELGRIGDAGPPLAVNLADLQTGAPVVVDSASAELGPEHLLASMGLLPDFPQRRSTASGSVTAASLPTCRCMRFSIHRRRRMSYAWRSTSWASRGHQSSLSTV
jgi:hypothetical protein